VARRSRAERFYARGALERFRAARSTRTLGANSFSQSEGVQTMEALGMGAGIGIGVLLALAIWITPSILIARTSSVSGRVRLIWAIGSFASVLIPNILIALAVTFLPGAGRLLFEANIVVSAVTWLCPWLVYWIFRKKQAAAHS
jgi:predicted RND superfamily exporter protein